MGCNPQEFLEKPTNLGEWTSIWNPLEIFNKVLVIINCDIKMYQKVTFKNLVDPLVRHGGPKRQLTSMFLAAILFACSPGRWTWSNSPMTYPTWMMAPLPPKKMPQDYVTCFFHRPWNLMSTILCVQECHFTIQDSGTPTDHWINLSSVESIITWTYFQVPSTVIGGPLFWIAHGITP